MSTWLQQFNLGNQERETKQEANIKKVRKKIGKTHLGNQLGELALVKRTPWGETLKERE